MGFSDGSVVKNIPANARNTGLIPGSGRSPGERNGNPPPVFLPRKSHGQSSLAGYSPWGGKRVRPNNNSKPVSTQKYGTKFTIHGLI